MKTSSARRPGNGPTILGCFVFASAVLGCGSAAPADGATVSPCSFTWASVFHKPYVVFVRSRCSYARALRLVR